MTLRVFTEMFPSDDACLAHLKERHYPDGTDCPSCGRASRFHRIRGRSAYSCQFCGTHVYPTAGTIFHKSTTSLRLWFWAIYLVASTRGSISVRELERETGVTYKTAGRMRSQIRNLIGAEWEAVTRKPRLAPAQPVSRKEKAEDEAPIPLPARPQAERLWHGLRRRR